MRFHTNIIIGFTALVVLASCSKKPTACFDNDGYLEAGDYLTLESCSENYEFLTWEFNDDRGYVSDIVERQFEFEGDYSFKLTAYAKGAYKSDELIHVFRASYRYVDRFEITGESDYSAFRIKFGDRTWNAGNAEGTFTEAEPFTVYALPEDTLIIPPTNSPMDFLGRKAFSYIPLGESDFNYHIFKDNPVVLKSEDGLLEMKMYWKFLD